MSKRVMDTALAVIALMLSSPLLLPLMVVIYWQDKHSPFYIATRVGRHGRPFRMIKLRSMIVGADRSGVDSTSAGDTRITPVGAFVRSYKLDELPQLVNVLKGEMSIVGPRPNVERETNLYTVEERHLLEVRPGITEIASIVFADEGEILEGREDPDIAYNQLIRPWKSRLALVYVRNMSLALDVRLIVLTAVAVLSRPRALAGVQRLLDHLNVDPELKRVARREGPLVPTPPPGTCEIVTSRALAAD